MEIQLAQLDHANGIAKIQIDSWRFAYKGIIDDELLSSLDVNQRSESWKLILQSERTTFIAINELGCIEGFICLCPNQDDNLNEQNIGEISSIYINPRLIGSRVGALLFKYGVKHLTNIGYTKIVLWVLEKNQLAINFYKKFGFTPDGGKKLHAKTGLIELRFTNAVII